MEVRLCLHFFFCFTFLFCISEEMLVLVRVRSCVSEVNAWSFLWFWAVVTLRDMASFYCCHLFGLSFFFFLSCPAKFWLTIFLVCNWLLRYMRIEGGWWKSLGIHVTRFTFFFFVWYRTINMCGYLLLNEILNPERQRALYTYLSTRICFSRIIPCA